MKQTISILTLLILLLVSCQKDGGQEEVNVEPIKPKDEYTKENPAEWKAVAKDHAPLVELTGKSGDNNIHITVPGTEFNTEHYIEKVGIIDKEKHELVSRSLEKGAHEASLTLKYDPDNLPDMKVYIKCNLHDVWTVTLDHATLKKH